MEAFEDKPTQTGFISAPEALAYTIDRISCEVIKHKTIDYDHLAVCGVFMPVFN